MMFDLKSARDGNTVSQWSESIYRMFIDGKLFVGNNGVSCFDSAKDAWNSFFTSNMWVKIQEYVDYSQRFFNKDNDNEWKTDFEEKIIRHLNILIKKYDCHE